MVNLLKTALGTVLFFLAYFGALIIMWIAPPLITILENGINTTLAGIAWFGVILIWIVGLLVVPIATIIWGITEKTQVENKMLLYSSGILYFIFSIAITYFSYYMVTPMTSVIDAAYPILTVLFYLGIIAIWIGNVIAVPIYMIIEAKEN